MLIEFDDKSYIEIKQSNKQDMIFISIAAKDAINQQKTIINSIEISTDQLKQLVENLIQVENVTSNVSDKTEISDAAIEKRGRGRPKKKESNE